MGRVFKPAAMSVQSVISWAWMSRDPARMIAVNMWRNFMAAGSEMYAAWAWSIRWFNKLIVESQSDDSALFEPCMLNLYCPCLHHSTEECICTYSYRGGVKIIMWRDWGSNYDWRNSFKWTLGEPRWQTLEHKFVTLQTYTVKCQHNRHGFSPSHPILLVSLLAFSLSVIKSSIPYPNSSGMISALSHSL